MKNSAESPIYLKIALDIAIRIASGDLKEGSRIMGRSTLASEYKVSPETIRRALSLLEEMEIVEVLPGSGVMIRSQSKANKYILRNNSQRTVLDLRNDIMRRLNEKHDIEDQIVRDIEHIIDYCERLKNLNPIYPVEFEVPPDSPLIGKMIIETQFWQKTGATIVGMRKNGEVIISPGPYAVFEKGDILLAVGNASMIDSVKVYLSNQTN